MSIMGNESEENNDRKMTRFQLWKDWYKHSLNHPVYKFLVLIGLAHSPTFQIHSATIEKFEQYPGYTYSVRDEKPEKTESKSDINWGWYLVYILMIALNSVMFAVHDCNIFSWQYWVYAAMLIMCFISGSNYRKKE